MALIKSKFNIVAIFAMYHSLCFSAELESINHSLIQGVGFRDMSKFISLASRYRADFKFKDYPIHALSEIGAEIVSEIDPRLSTDISLGAQLSYDVIKYIPYANVQLGTRIIEITRTHLRVGVGVSRVYQGGWFTFGEFTGRTWLAPPNNLDGFIFLGVGFAQDVNSPY